ncbi:MAG: hypothetical protein HC896_17600 [Bacteroidales bacterium]|nr:hypothetical protein [Bacteroidales bacterium]
MFFSQRKITYFIALLLVTVSSCSKYEKLLKSSDHELKYKKAFEYYNDENYAKAINLFEQLAPIYRGTEKADSVNFFMP